MASRVRRSKHSANRGPLSKIGVVVVVIAGLLVVGCVSAFAVCSAWLEDLPDYTDASAYNYAEKTSVYANDGKTLLAEFYLENRDPVSLDEISDYVKKGTVATEDERFYEHNGVDLQGIARALWVNITGTGYEGASTITQQFVRNTILADEMNESTLKRKVREAYIAIQLEQIYSKDEILQMYLNTINYGQGAYGIEAAAQLYYSKSASDLTIAEAATLIGIPQSPTYNNPINDPERCLNRRNTVLDRMLSNDVITQEEHDAAQAEDLNLNVSETDSTDGIYKYDYFTSYVRDTLLSEYSTEEVFKGGLTVITTLDVDMQRAAEEAAETKYKSLSDNLELALVAVDPDTGYIKALIGGKDYSTDQYNLATQAQRQPGSSFKTFTLLAALDSGISPDTKLDCRSTVEIDGWKVSNYGGSDYGVRTVAGAFTVSSNTGFAELVTEIGASKVVNMAQTCGINKSELDAVPSITLGTEEVTVREMAQAYATIANGGTYREAVCIQEIQDSSGATIYRADTTGEKVLDTALTQAATEIMKTVVTSGTGTRARLSSGQEVAGKTGTSQNYRDKWFCGITPQLSVAIWIGGREEVSMPTSVRCDDVFSDFVGEVLDDQPIEKFPTTSEKLEYTTYNIGYGSLEPEEEKDSDTETDETIDKTTDETTKNSTDTGSSGTTTNSSGTSSGGTTGGSSGTTGGSGGSSGTGSGGSSGSEGSSSGGDTGGGSSGGDGGGSSGGDSGGGSSDETG